MLNAFPALSSICLILVLNMQKIKEKNKESKNLCRPIQQMKGITEDIEDSSWKLDYILGVFIKAWEAGELNSLPAGKVRMAWISLKVARNLNQIAIRMLERDQKWRRRGARVFIKLSLYCNQYVKRILE